MLSLNFFYLLALSFKSASSVWNGNLEQGFEVVAVETSVSRLSKLQLGPPSLSEKCMGFCEGSQKFCERWAHSSMGHLQLAVLFTWTITCNYQIQVSKMPGWCFVKTSTGTVEVFHSFFPSQNFNHKFQTRNSFVEPLLRNNDEPLGNKNYELDAIILFWGSQRFCLN